MLRIGQLHEIQATNETPQEGVTAVRAALYRRVSTAAQADRWSLGAQEKTLNELADRNGWDGVLYDEGAASGETLADRPVMQRLLADVIAGRIDMVAVVEMERLGRGSDLRDWATISSTFREAGVLVATPERIFNLAAAEDDFEADLRGILSKREKRKLLERTARGMREAKDHGRYVGGTPPTGYLYDPLAKKLVPDPEAAPLVQQVFESQLSPWKLHRQLRANGTPLHYETIRRMRQNPAYIGKRHNSTGELIDADWEPLVDPDVWERWQRPEFRAKRRSSTQKGPRYLLSGIARCAACGGPVVGTPVKPAKDGAFLFAYRCYLRCPDGGQLPGWLVDRVVREAILEYADPAALKARFREAAQAAEDPDRARTRRDCSSRVAELDERQAKLLDAVERGTLDDRVIRDRMKTIEAERRVVEATLETLDGAESIPSLPGMQEILDLAGKREDLDGQELHRLLERLVTRVEVGFPNRVLGLAWRLSGRQESPVPNRRRACPSTS